MTRTLLGILCAAVLSLVQIPFGWAQPPGREDLAPRAEVLLFTRRGCPRCADAKAFINELAQARPELTTLVMDVEEDRGALLRLRGLAEAHGAAGVSVPAFYVRGKLVVGYAGRQTTGVRIEALLDRSPTDVNNGVSDEGGACSAETVTPCEPEPKDTIELPWLGKISVGALGLPIFTIVVGLIDGFNPCAMWVLMFLLALLVGLHNRAKMLLIAGIFVLVSALAYYAFMAAWLNVFLIVGLSRGAQVALGAVALCVGAVHVKDFFAFKKGLSFSIPERAKPTIYARMRSIVQADHLVAALASATVLAILVNAVELLCTAGLPALYTEILVSHGLPRYKHYAYLGLYDLAYMTDDIVMVAIAVITLGRRKLQERGGRLLKLLGGATMIMLGGLLILKPEWLVF